MTVRAAPIVLVLVLGGAGDARGSGFEIREQSAVHLGSSFAGAGVSSEDASVLFFNPAGIGLFDAPEIQVGLSNIQPTSRLVDGSGATDATGAAATGGTGGDAGTPAPVPNLYFVSPVGERVTVGFGLNSPFGLATTYDEGWIGRYHALTSELRTVTLSAVAAYEVSPSLIVGGGPTLTYADARLTKSIDFGSICLGALGSAGCAAAGVSPQSADGASDLTADAWGFGFTLGLLWRPVDGTRIGVSWRSQTDLRFSGEADFSVPAQASFLTAGGTFTDSGVSGGIVLPETTRLDIHQDIGRRWSVMAGLAWTAWSRFDELRFEFENPAQPTSVTPENWKDTFFFSAGATYRPDDRWAFRVGLAFDQSPVDDAFRTPVLPGEDRYWVSVGADYRIGDRVSVSASYLHVFLENASIDTLDPLGGRLVGSYEAAADVFALGLRVRF